MERREVQPFGLVRRFSGIHLVLLAAVASGCRAPGPFPGRVVLPGAGSIRPNPPCIRDYVRFVGDCGSFRPSARWVLRTAVHTLVHPETGVHLTLLAMNHFGTAEYYRGLEACFAGIDVVLEEGGSGASEKPGRLASDLSWYPRFYRAAAGLLGGRRQRDWEEEVRDGRWQRVDLPLEWLDGELQRQSISLFSGSGKDHLFHIEHLLAGGGDGPEREREREWLISTLQKNFLALGGPGGSAWAAINDSRREEIFRGLRRILEEGTAGKIALVYGAAHLAVLGPRILSELGFREEGVTWHDALVLEIEPRDADSHLRRGLLWAREGALGAAKADYWRALDLAPINWPSRSLAEELLRELEARP